MGEDRDRFLAGEPMTEKLELAALRNAFEMMGLDPTKVAEFSAHPRDATCKHILMQFVGLDERKLAARVGQDTNLSAWREMYARLKRDSNRKGTTDE